MSKIRIYSKKTFSIGPGATKDGKVDEFITVPRAIQEIDEKYTEDATFKLAVKSGDIQIMQSPIEVPVYNNSNEKEVVKDPVKTFYDSLKGKDSREIRELSSKYGAEFVEDDKLSANKKRVLEAYKIFIKNNETVSE